MTVTLTARVFDDYATNVVGFSCSNGRRSKTDTYSAATANLEIRSGGLPASWVLGALVVVEQDSSAICKGYITNVDYNYNFATNADTYTVSLEGYLSFFGRSVLTNFTMSNQTTGAAANAIASAISGTGKTISAIRTRSYVDTSTYSGPAQNLITSLVSMEQGRLDDYGSFLRFLGRDFTYQDFSEPWAPIIPQYLFADDGTSGYSTYDNIIFSALSNNYFTYTQIVPNSVATQVAGSGNRTLSLNTYDISTTQAQDLANYALAEFDATTSVPVEISVKSTMTLQPGFLSQLAGYRIGTQTVVKFRGSTYNAVVEGFTISGTPEEMRYTFYLSGFEQNNFLVLDDPVFGVWDNNNWTF